MKKKSFIHPDLSKKQLEILKNLYIEKKVDSMSDKELKEFVLEIITHQINDTIGKEEEMEAWNEMSDFFGEQFEIIIQDILNKFQDVSTTRDIAENSHKLRLELLEKNNIEKEKKDMWDD